MERKSHFFPLQRPTFLAFNCFLIMLGILAVAASIHAGVTWYEQGTESLNRFGRLFPISLAGGLLLLYIIAKPLTTSNAGLFVSEAIFGFQGAAFQKQNVYKIGDIEALEVRSLKLIPFLMWTDNLLSVTLRTNGKRRILNLNCDQFGCKSAEVLALLEESRSQLAPASGFLGE
ncbi:hypothetical protein ACFO5Q_01930 [Kordiimonas lipolytica]|uniref:PH domain-containing protein n=1 Tax=Kordiimonas lipolytica TaxID=1662421 RepID=A0ABV8U6Y0_9PROT|nr:hypothetical protein [Kordiimonas lipolytica]